MKFKNTENFLRWDTTTTASLNIETSDARKTVRRGPLPNDGATHTIISSFGFESGVHIFHISINKITGTSPIIGIALPAVPRKSTLGSNNFSIGWGSQMLYVNGASPVPFGPKFLESDIISVELDLIKGTITFYRNEALVAVAVGPKKSDACMQMKIGRGPFYPAVSLFSLGDSVSFVSRPFYGSSENTRVSSYTNHIYPDWFLPLRESMALLRSCAARELPVSVIENEFVPFCSEKAKAVIETSHPYDGQLLERAVVIEGSESIVISIDPATRLGSRDVVKLNFRDEDGSQQSIELFGLDGSMHGTENFESRTSISVGDKVVRGPSWQW